MKTFRKHLQDLHLYFRNSANRISALKAAASDLQVADLKVTVGENIVGYTKFLIEIWILMNCPTLIPGGYGH